MRRYLFPVAPSTRPVGGRNVILWIIDQLVTSGREAGLINGSQDQHYEFYQSHSSIFTDSRLRTVYGHPTGPVNRISRKLLRASSPTPDFLSGEDVIIVPEFRYPEILPLYPNNPRIVFVQNSYSMARALARDLSRGKPVIGEALALLAISEETRKAAKTLTGIRCIQLRPLVHSSASVDLRSKSKTILYMPRKRREEAQMITTILRGQPEIAGFEIVAIDGRPSHEVIKAMTNAEIFLSFSNLEGFGLPPAEAMAAGCLTIGYTGTGGNEYFFDETGFPVPDGDITKFIATVKDVARRISEDRRYFDQKRYAAMKLIRETYSEQACIAAIQEGWSRLEAIIAESRVRTH